VLRPKLNGFFDGGAKLNTLSADTLTAGAVGATVRAGVGTVGAGAGTEAGPETGPETGSEAGSEAGPEGSVWVLLCGNVVVLGGADFGKVQEVEERSTDSRVTRDRDRVCCRSAEGVTEKTSGTPGH